MATRCAWIAHHGHLRHVRAKVPEVLHRFAQVCVARACPSGQDSWPMGRLDDLDLTQKLKRKEQDELLETRGGRLAQLRLALGGQLGPATLGPACCVLVRGLGRRRQGRGDQAPRRAARRPPRARRAASPRRRPTRSATTTCSASGPRCPAAAAWPCFDRTWYGRVLVERVEGFATEEQWRRAYDEIDEFERHARRRGHDHREVLAAHLRGRAAHALRAAPRRPAEGAGRSPTRTGATARSARSTTRRSRRCSSAPTPRPRRGAGPGRLEALRARQGDAR